jgi:6-pyruvoyltetrahydropterin/6-carboxytetrahydropterin synthase
MFEVEVSAPLHFRHRLMGFGEKFEAEHEHTWNIQITARTKNLDRRGACVDFVDMKKKLVMILEPLQAKLLNDHSPFDSLQPTAEHIAQWAAKEMEKSYPGLITEVTVGTTQEKAKFIVD